MARAFGMIAAHARNCAGGPEGKSNKYNFWFQ
jgi:hypothetical protein